MFDSNSFSVFYNEFQFVFIKYNIGHNLLFNTYTLKHFMHLLISIVVYSLQTAKYLLISYVQIHTHTYVQCAHLVYFITNMFLLEFYAVNCPLFEYAGITNEVHTTIKCIETLNKIQFGAEVGDAREYSIHNANRKIEIGIP